MRKSICMFTGVILSLVIDLSANEECQNDIDSCSIYYEKTINYIRDNKLEDASYCAKQFQADAYRFKLACKEKFEAENKRHVYKKVLKQLVNNESWLYKEGVLKENLLSQ